MTASSDRNLLFGILALQMDFITRDQLVSAINAWALEKSKPLGQILVEQHVLSASKRELLEPLVAQHVADHGSDAQKSLAALSSIESRLRQRLAALPDATVQASIAQIGVDGTRTDANATIAQASGDATTAERYRIIRAHARGGLGEVFVAEDIELGRRVALKEIQPRHADDAASRGRFVLEAEITGGLEHPGIVPVYGLGAYPDGRPFYTMRFIKGDNFSDAIRRFHGDTGSPNREQGLEKTPLLALRAPNFDSLEFRQLLQRFIDVCNAVAYAHSRGVLHRDLKPGNIMLGKYGETLVVDWGLAKLAGSPQREPGADETILAPRSGGDSSATVAGRAMGTPAYMPPEQAAGDWETIGPASDVYSLGATLYELLTGKKPFESRMVEVVLDDVRAGRLPAPRRLLPEVPRALEAVCRKAMALKPADRYASPLELSKEIERWLADEPVTAYTEPFSFRARRWVRKHSRLTTGIAAAFLVGAIGFGALAWQRESARKAVENEQIETAKERDRANENLSFAKKGNEILGSVFAGLDPKRIAESGRPLQDVLKENLTKAVLELEGTAIGNALAVADMQMTLGSSLIGLGQYDQAAAVFEKVRTTRQRQLGPDHPDTLASINELANSYYARGRHAEALALREETLKIRTAKLGADHPDTLTSMHNLSTSYFALGRYAEALPLREETLKLRKAKIGLDHPDTLTSMNNLANSYAAVGRHAEALALREETLKLEKAKLGLDHSATLGSMNNLAMSYGERGRHAEAVALHEDTLKLKRAKLGPDHPDTLRSMHNLAVSYVDVGRHAEALALYEETLQLRKAKLGPDHPNTILTMTNLVVSYVEADRADDAIAVVDDALPRALKAPGVNPGLVPTLMERRLAAMAKKRDAAGCRATAEMWEKLNRTDADGLYTAACFRAVTASMVKVDAKTPDADVGQRAGEEADKAMDWLKKAVARGYKNVEHMKKDTDLDALRQREDFKKLIAELEAKSKP